MPLEQFAGTPDTLGPDVLETLKHISSGTLTTQLFKRGLRQSFLVGLKPMNPQHAQFVGEAFTMRLIPAREDIDTYKTLTPYSNPDNLQWEGVEQIRPGQVLVIVGIAMVAACWAWAGRLMRLPVEERVFDR